MTRSHTIDPRAAALDSFLDRHPEPAAGTDGIAIFRAVAGSYLDRFRGRPVQCGQTYRPHAAALERRGLAVVAEPEAPAGLCIVFATKYKEETLYHLARATSLLAPGGMLVVAAANELGAPSLEKRCGELIGGVASYSKHKCRVFWGRKDPSGLNGDLRDAWLDLGRLRKIEGTELVAQPGVFSWKAIDPGSRLLAEHLPEGLAGRGADLGAGYGYLGHALLSRPHGVAEWHLFEAELKALDAARRNLAGFASTTALHYHWCDVTAGLPEAPFDFILMNPPFHTGRDAEPGLGRAFIRAAVAALKPDGRLYLVANRHLPYEEELRAGGCGFERLAGGESYKVIEARPIADTLSRKR
jgi:16S rRNA (guanine1207-N2)-methyltransferase